VGKKDFIIWDLCNEICLVKYYWSNELSDTELPGAKGDVLHSIEKHQKSGVMTCSMSP
jgi:hypothetical protein